MTIFDLSLYPELQRRVLIDKATFGAGNGFLFNYNSRISHRHGTKVEWVHYRQALLQTLSSHSEMTFCDYSNYFASLAALKYIYIKPPEFHKRASINK